MTPDTTPAATGTSFRILSGGGPALAALSAMRDGRVLALFGRSFYVEAGSRALSCMGTSAIGPGPLNAVCDVPGAMDFEASGLRVGDRVRRSQDRIVAGARFVFMLDGASEWRPAAFPPEFDAATLQNGLAVLAAEAKGLAEGLGGWIPALILEEGPGPQAGEGPFWDAAWAAARGLLGWLEGRGGGSLRSSEGLIGLGPGLTPSGDDFIGGAMIALRLLGQGRCADRLADWALPLAKECTNRISLAHLECAARGLGAGALHEVLSALAHPGAPGLVSALKSVGRIGHTSGWDALAGAAAVCAGLARSR